MNKALREKARIKLFPVNYYLLPVICYLLTVTFLACRTPYDPPRPEKAAAGTGSFSLAISGVRTGRTILPATVQSDFKAYTLKFYTADTIINPVITVNRTNANLSDPVIMNAGIWDLQVTAFMDAERTKPAAQGSLPGIAIPEGGSVSRGVTLNAIIGTGEGTFRWNIDYPVHVIEASMAIIPLDGGPEQTVYFTGGTPIKGKEDYVSLSTGYYRVVFQLLDDKSQSTERKDILHVYQNMESYFEFTFTEGHFTYLIVTNGADSGPESLRAAIEGAPDYSTIIIDENVKTITLADGLSVNKSLTIEGNGVTVKRETNSAMYSLLNAGSGTITIKRVWFRGGSANSGGAINSTADLTLESCIFSGNQALNGGAVINGGILSVKGCTFYANSANNGGAVHNSGSLTLEGNLFFGNTAQAFPVIYHSGGAASAGCNTVDAPLGTDPNESGWAPEATDTSCADLGITVPAHTETMKPVILLGSVIPAAPADFPTADFHGNTRYFPGAPGAVAELTAVVTVTFNINEGPAPVQQITASGNNIDEPSVISKAGHTFDGWYTESDYTAQWDFAAGVAEDMPLHAQWVPIPYTVTYNSNGATGGTAPSDVTVYHIGNTVTLLGNTGNMVRTGHLFAGWNTESDGDGTRYTGGSTIAVETENITLYARWVAGDTNSIGINMVQINAGTFTMGSSDPQDNDASPPHQVTLSYSFYMGMYEVTQGQYQEIIKVNPSHFNSDDPVSGEGQAKRPVEMVTWYDALLFCNRLSDSEQLTRVYTMTDRTLDTNGSITSATVLVNWSANGYRLPTEAEWEYACRAGTTTAYSFGDGIDDLTIYGWYLDNSGMITHEVGKKTPNAWGLFDMHGNVWEWCWDWPWSYSSEVLFDPVGASSGSRRVLRGGRWGSQVQSLRSAFRNSEPSSVLNSNIGFRIARGPIVPTVVTTITPAINLEMVQIKPGTFMMGSSDPLDNVDSNASASPPHQVTLTNGFYIGKYEVTQELYKAVTGGSEPSHFSGSPASGENPVKRPVDNVSWYDAIEFCNKLSGMEGLTPVYTITSRSPEYKPYDISGSYPITSATVTANWSANGYRLPTEAEWEYACRAGTTSAYNTGGTISYDTGWYNANSGSIGTREVGLKPPNAWGLFDMHGNVWEWCWDWFASYTDGHQTDPVGSPLGTARVDRGGAWTSSPESMRSKRRGYYALPNIDIGFRIARGPINSTITTPTGTEMIKINAGFFTMGSSDILDNYASPPHKVTLTNGFYMGKYEVTQEQYQAVTSVNPSNFSGGPTSGETQEKRPVEQVTWYDAVEFCNKLSGMEGLTPVYTITSRSPEYKPYDIPGSYPITSATVTANWNASGYRLPTEAEWEYACRAGTITVYNTGNTITNDTGWYESNSEGKTHEVGQKPPNAWGLHDMHGNVWEWCWDWYGSYSSGDQENPVGTSSGPDHIARGGSCLGGGHYLRSAFRVNAAQSYQSNDIGFRIVRP